MSRTIGPEIALQQTTSNILKLHIISTLLLLAFVSIIITSSTFAHQLPKEQQQQQQQDLLESQCVACIRSVTSAGIDLSRRCEGSNYCGPFQFSYQYWAEAGKPGNVQGIREFEKCARDKQCAEQTVRAYYRKFKKDCNSDGHLDCLDMAALHKAGPASCSHDWFYKSRYWLAFNKTSCVLNRTPFDPTTAIVQPNQDMQQAEQAKRQPPPPPPPMKNQTLTSECLDCICEALTSCAGTHSNNAASCGSGLVCGPFAISQSYWKDGRRPGASWTACARTKECSSLTIRNYMDKHKRDCNNDGLITCEDYAAIHRRGPMSCTNRDLIKEQYWTRFTTCRANQKPQMHDANTVRLDETVVVTADQSVGTTSTTPTSRSGDDSTLQMTTQSLASSSSRQTYASPPPSTTTSTTIMYDLNPVVYETKASSNSIRNLISQQQTIRPQSYESPPPPPGASYYPPGDVGTHTPEYQSYQETSAPSPPPPHSRRPLIDYSSLPVIIVSKPLGAQSTNRISEPPTLTESVVSLYPTTDTPHTTTTTTTTITSMTTTPPPTHAQSSSGSSTSGYYNELTTTYPLSSSGAPNQNLVGLMDYATTLDFSLNNDPMVANIDRAVIDIMAHPDFSKSYPPVNESLIMQRKQQVNPPLGSRTTGSAIITNQVMSSTIADVSTSATNKRENSKTMSPNIYNNVELDSPNGSNNNNNNNLPQIFGPDALNVSTLFDPTKGFGQGLNESSRIASECLDCICDASSNCDSSVQCISKQREKNRCGLYMISWNQFKESDISLTSLLFSSSAATTTSSSSSSSSSSNSQTSNDDYDVKLYYECTTDKNCAEKLIHLYIEKYQMDCNQDGKIDCYDIAAIHRVGPESCNSNKFLTSQYWHDFSHCYATDRLTTTTTTATTTTTTTTTSANQSVGQTQSGGG